MTCLVSPSQAPRAALWPHWTMHHAPKRPFHVSYPLLGAFSPQRSLWGTTSAPSSLYTSHPHSVHPPQTASLSLPLPTPFPAFSIRISVQFTSVQSLSRVRLFATPWIAARQASLSITNSRSSLRLTSIESVHSKYTRRPTHPSPRSQGERVALLQYLQGYYLSLPLPSVILLFNSQYYF